LIPAFLVGCRPRAAVRPVFNTYDRVVIDTSSNQAEKSLIVPQWMRAFPLQSVLDWDYVRDTVGIPNLRDPRHVRKVRYDVGVKGVVHVSEAGSGGQVSIWVVDTENGETVASVLVKAKARGDGNTSAETPRESMIKEAIAELSAEAKRTLQESTSGS